MNLESQVQQLGGKSQSELLKDWYSLRLNEAVGGDVDELVSDTDDILGRFETWCRQIDLESVLCKSWDYCGRQKTHGKNLTFAALVADFLCTTLGLPIPIIAASSVLIVLHGFDKFCKCDED